MTPFVPKELRGKLRYKDNKVYLRDGVKLNEHDTIVFNDYKANLEKELKKRWE